ncbi:MAG: hypothetical protein BJ554DRAFT_6692 [Olpidium bornovanus]|uniref:Rad21/Rec8-like protein N-terminal domain-containing protein n=1 Tax=Olpidium bornovanus TaxID=278681 RepID=A0A8H7ZXA0_9FUNG|nr:MAG: hypothetical protein BJ554DRAFT_6692 [Olpidium bornovanus]
MFYSEGVLARKGPLARVWLAAHWERRLTKAQFLQTNIQDCVAAHGAPPDGTVAARGSEDLLPKDALSYGRMQRGSVQDQNCEDLPPRRRGLARGSGYCQLKRHHFARRGERAGHVPATGVGIHLKRNLTLHSDITGLICSRNRCTLGRGSNGPWDAALNPAASQNISRPQDITLRESSDLLSSVGGSNDSPGMFNANFDILGGDDARGVEFNLDLDGERRDKEDLTSPMEVEVGRDAAPEQAFAPEMGGGSPSADKTFDDGGGDGRDDPLMPADEHEPPAFENVEAELGIA